MTYSRNTRATAAQSLARFICDLSYAQIPADAVWRCRELLLDQLGCQLIGASVPWNQPVYRFVKSAKGGGPAKIVKYADRVPTDDAVLVNGTFAQGCELDDYYDQGGGHPGAATVPSDSRAGAAADGQRAGADHSYGRRLRSRLAHRPRALAGIDARAAITRRAWSGVFIAAAAAGKILRLDPEQMTHALAIAGSHSGGTMEYDQSGGEVKRLHNGMACCGGLRSALLAQNGLTGPPTIFEGERGILKSCRGLAMSSRSSKTSTPGNEDLALYHAAMKRFPVNASQHSPIELLDSLVREHNIDPSQVTKIKSSSMKGSCCTAAPSISPRKSSKPNSVYAFLSR